MQFLNKYDVEKVLLIDPNFPLAHKSRNHSDLLPVGLLKIGAYLKNKHNEQVKNSKKLSGTTNI